MFVLSHEANSFFEKIDKESRHGKFGLKFDYYYLCLVAGFIKKDISKDIRNGSDLVKAFPTEFHSQREQIIGLLIATEIERNKINKDNRERLEKLMLELVQPDSPSKLSPKGLKLMNRYAQSGFDYISEKIPSPYNLDTFLIQYYNEIINQTNKLKK